MQQEGIATRKRIVTNPGLKYPNWEKYPNLVTTPLNHVNLPRILFVAESHIYCSDEEINLR